MNTAGWSVYLTEDVANAVYITWSAHHATQKRSKPFEVRISALMPLMRDQAHSVATIKHALKKICDTVAFLNPGQTPVVVAETTFLCSSKANPVDMA